MQVAGACQPVIWVRGKPTDPCGHVTCDPFHLFHPLVLLKLVNCADADESQWTVSHDRDLVYVSVLYLQSRAHDLLAIPSWSLHAFYSYQSTVQYLLPCSLILMPENILAYWCAHLNYVQILKFGYRLYIIFWTYAVLRGEIIVGITNQEENL